MRKNINKNPLFFSFLFPAITDGIVTILGQDKLYWISRAVNEASPAYYVLILSPLLFLVGSVIWFGFWYWIFKRLKEPFNLFLMFLFIAGHSWGSTSWIWKIMKDNGIYIKENQISIIFVWVVAVFYFSLIAIFATYCLRIYINNKNN
jgi:hypothetical protein